jgi:hypothetical protein
MMMLLGLHAAEWIASSGWRSFFDEPAFEVTWATAAAIGGIVTIVAGAAVAYLRALLKSEIVSMENTLVEKAYENQQNFKIDIKEIIALNVAPLAQRVERLEKQNGD